jgi:hypothetical protein
LFYAADFTAHYSDQWLQAVATKFVGKANHQEGEFQKRQWQGFETGSPTFVTRPAIKTSLVLPKVNSKIRKAAKCSKLQNTVAHHDLAWIHL